VAYTLSKKERLTGRKGMPEMMSEGHFGYVSGIRYCYITDSGADCNRIIISVSKRLFKRAVKRNLLKRRIRESYRLQKGLLPSGKGIDILFIYNTNEVLDFATLYSSIGNILLEISKKLGNDVL
jgi:hypothetical protein